MATGPYWWSGYGDFPPGECNLPHMGAVVGHYRRKRYETQHDFAIAAGVELRTVREWETAVMIPDMKRRIFLARLLQIPPALLGLDWRTVYYEDAGGTPLEESMRKELAREESYYQYETILRLAWRARRQGTLVGEMPHLQRWLSRLELATSAAPSYERDIWQSLLCGYHTLAAAMQRQLGGSDPEARWRVLRYYEQALRLANDLEDAQLIARAYFGLAEAYIEYGDYPRAKEAAEAGLGYAERVQPPLRGNLYLVSAAAHVPLAQGDETQQKQCLRWQEQALRLVYQRKMEEDGSFLKLNLAGVHHERAKLLLELGKQRGERSRLREAEEEVASAWKALPPELVLWQLYFTLTEARIYEAQGEVEGSVQQGKRALELAKQMGSRRGEEEVRGLYQVLKERAGKSPYVHNLGAELGLF
jgi:transcriptional regulator with XRE-family HTH domain